jgi:hypothetical protein
VKFSLKWLLGLTSLIALALTSAVAPVPNWFPEIIFTATVVALLWAIPASVYARGPKSAFYVGFAIAGWGYLLLTCWPGLGADTKLMSRPIAEALCWKATGSLGDLAHFWDLTQAWSAASVACLGGWVASRFCARDQAILAGTSRRTRPTVANP